LTFEADESRHCYQSFHIVKVDLLFFLALNMSSPSFRAPGDIVNEVYLDKIQSIIQLCSDVGDEPSSLIEQAKRELQVSKFRCFLSRKILIKNYFYLRKWSRK